MGVMSLERFPDTISRSTWRVVIDGEPLGDWVGVNFRWVAQGELDEGMEIQVIMPLASSAESRSFVNFMLPYEKGRTIDLLANGETKQHPGFRVVAAQAVRYEFLPVVMTGTRLEGLDRRSDWPVLQAVTFRAKLKDQPRRTKGDLQDGEGG